MSQSSTGAVRVAATSTADMGEAGTCSMSRSSTGAVRVAATSTADMGGGCIGEWHWRRE